MDPSAPDGGRPARPEEERCCACGQQIRPPDSRTCALCGRRACLRCLAPYGHYMHACADCRLGAW